MNKGIAQITSQIPNFEIFIGIIILLLLLTVILLLKRYNDIRILMEKLLSQKKSSEVRTGKISEVLAPFTGLFPVDVKKIGTSTVFIGQPIDYMHFDPEEGITFIEIKSGNSALSSDQKKFKKMIEDGMIYWEEIRIKG